MQADRQAPGITTKKVAVRFNISLTVIHEDGARHFSEFYDICLLLAQPGRMYYYIRRCQGADRLAFQGLTQSWISSCPREGTRSTNGATRSPSAGSMLGQRHRRWPNIEPALGDRVVFDGE